MRMAEDEPGPSGVVPPNRPKVAWTISRSSEEDHERVDPEQEAWTDFTERISVAGWKEAFDEPIIWIRQQYKVALIIFSAFSFYYIYQVVQQFIASGYVDEISDYFELPALAMSNVTICAQVYFNQTFIRENLTISTEIWSRVAKLDKVSDQEFYRELALFLTPVMRLKSLHPLLIPLFEKVVRANPQIRDYTSFAKAAWPKCDAMLRKCMIDGVEFGCCKDAVFSLDDDGVCFLIPLNMDNDNANPTDATVHQRTPGPDGGLTVEARLDVADSPWISDDAQNGFRVLVGHTSMSVLASPISVPHGSETYIKVIPEKHSLASNCTPRGNLRFPYSREHQYMYYDPEGESCTVTKVVDRATFMAQCHLSVYLYLPNASVVCSPGVVNSFISLMVEENSSAAFIETTDGAKAIGQSKEKLVKRFADVESGVKDIFNKKSFCPHHCQYWTYRSTASFHNLENRHDNAEVVDYMFSRIHVYYGTLDYRQHREVVESSVYLAFCDFGNVVGLYWGMSIVSFFHVFYYVPRYFYVKQKMRRVQSIQQTAVQCIATSSV